MVYAPSALYSIVPFPVLKAPSNPRDTLHASCESLLVGVVAWSNTKWLQVFKPFIGEKEKAKCTIVFNRPELYRLSYMVDELK